MDRSAPPRAPQPPTLPSPKIRLARPRWWWSAVALGVVGAFVVILHLAASPAPTVKHIAFVNNSVYDVEVDASGASAGGTLPLGTAPAHRTTDVQDVVDQGSTWVLHFSAQGTDGGELRLARADLIRDGWRVVIPTGVAQRFAAAGLQASPGSGG